MARITDLHKKWLKEPKYRKAHEALEEEFVLASAVIHMRNRAGLTQEELARKMGSALPKLPARGCSSASSRIKPR